jgi:nucleoside-diphosphate-sugar epimerase
MAILITGASGLIASRVADRLAGAGERVVGHSRRPDAEIIELVIGPEARENITWVAGDILDYGLLVETVRENEVDAVIHCAAIMGDDIKADPAYATRVNCAGTVNCFQAAKELGLKKVIFLSSSAAFPARLPAKPREKWGVADLAIYPFGLYGAAKLYGEHAAEYYYRTWGTDITTLRIGSICYGVGHRHGKSADLMRELLLRPALGELGVVQYDPEATDTFLHADDAARAAVLALDVKREKTRGAVFDLRGPESSVKAIRDYVLELLPGASITLLPGPSMASIKDVDTTATERDLGFRPHCSVEEGVRQTIDRMRRSHGLPPI